MTDQLRPGVIVLALVALATGVIGLRTLASSESDTVPAGQPFVVEADYSTVVEEAPTELGWTRPPSPRNPFLANDVSPLAIESDGGAFGLTLIPDDSSEFLPTSDGGTGSSDPLGNAPAAPEPGEVVEIDIGPDDPFGLGG